MSTDRILSSRRIYDGWLSLDLLSVELRGQVVERAFVEHPSGAVVLAYDPSRKVGFVVQETRLAALREGRAPVWEPAGGAVEDQDDFETARREAIEEIGVELRHLELVGRAAVTPSTSSERISLFLAEYEAGDRTEAGGGMEGELEHLHIAEVPLADLWAPVPRGELVDLKMLTLLQALMLRRPDLFAA